MEDSDEERVLSEASSAHAGSSPTEVRKGQFTLCYSKTRVLT